MEQNQITLTGVLCGPAEYSHSNHGRRFFVFYLEVERLSGAVDRLRILAPELLLAQSPVEEGDCLTVCGQIRSFNSRSSAGRRLVISVLAESLTVTPGPHVNDVQLIGVICREPVYRRWAHHVITDFSSPEATAERILEAFI